MQITTRGGTRWGAVVLAVAVTAAGATTAQAAVRPAAPAGGPALAAAAGSSLSAGRAVTASSTENAGYLGAGNAVDGDAGTRWASQASDDQWIQVDLGERTDVGHVLLHWEAAYGRGYEIQVSDDGGSWSTIRTVTDGDGGTDALDVEGAGRYLRVQGTQRGTGYGYSLFELQVFGTPAGGGGEDDGGSCGTAAPAPGRVATASSVEHGGTPAGAAVDGDRGTRWSSAFSDAQWLQVDLGAVATVCEIVLDWEGAYGAAFEVETSADGTSWTTVAAVTDGTGGHQAVDVRDTTARYVRLDLQARGTGYGYSLWEVEIATGGTTVGEIPGGGDLGPNVHLFTDDMSDADIQVTLDEVFRRQETAQFGLERDQLLFAPGTYDVQAHIGFNTSINGLGRDPDDVHITGGVWVDAQWFGGNATQNFWRSAENFSVTPFTGEMRWATSQAAPFRRVHVKGDLALHSSVYGWASGGYIADSRVDGRVGAWTQQQWYTRDSTLGSWEGTLWNMVFSGVENAPPTSFPEPKVTTLATTGVIREKPYLYLDGDDLAVFVPELRTGTRGTTWEDGPTPGTSIPVDQFYVVQEGDTAARINAAVDQGLHLLFPPGIYRVDDTIEVNRAGTVVLGLGYATIIPEGGRTAMRVGDVDGVKIASILFDAGLAGSPALLEVGSEGSTADHADDPISLHDVFARVGGVVPGRTESALVVNADDTIIDHIWSWRADHGEGVGWTQNTSDHGLVVNGDDVSGYGLFVEHYQEYNLLWNGERGRVVFFQNELPYDVPSQDAWQNGDRRGYAGYKVADHVTRHEAWGLGSYLVFTTDPSIVVDAGFEVPDTPGVRMHSLSVVSLGGQGTYEHVINDTGPRATGTETIPSTVTSYSGGG